MATSELEPSAPGRRSASLTAGQARRLALAAQGLGSPPPARVTARTLRGLLQRLGAIQIDSINVVARSHELVLAARTGIGTGALFDKVIYGDRAGFEYWGHAASFLPIETYRLFLPRMRRMVSTSGGWSSSYRETHADVYRAVLDRVRAEGPLPASAFRDPDGPKRGSWWDWSPAKHVLEDLYAQGVLMVHDRVRFERRYDIAERVLPAGVDLTEPTPLEAARELVWAKPGYLLAGTRIPRKTEFPPTLLSPFDSLVWASMSGARERTARLFGFDYKLEIYIPAAKRVHGYYTTPVLAGGRLVARVDPKLDRKSATLLLRGVHLEPGVDLDEGLAAVAGAAWRLAPALGASAVELDGPAADGAMLAGEIIPGTARSSVAALAAHAPSLTMPVLDSPDPALAGDQAGA